MSRAVHSSAGGQKMRVGVKAKAFNFSKLKREIDAGFRHFQNKRPVGAVSSPSLRQHKAMP